MLQISRKKIQFSGFVSDSRQILSLSKMFGEIPTKIYQNLTSICKIQSKNAENWIIHYSFSKKVGRFLTDILNLERCKVWLLCRYRKMLQNAYLDTKIGFDTEENEPPKVWRWIIHFDSFASLARTQRRTASMGHRNAIELKFNGVPSVITYSSESACRDLQHAR